MDAASCSPLSPWGVSEVLVSLGPLPIRWYALAYIAGLLLGWHYAHRLIAAPRLWGPRPGPAPSAAALSRDDVDELLFLAVFGVILGGRIGYIIFYMPSTNPEWSFFEEPWRVLQIWNGGMAFHGGLIGVGLAMAWLAWRRNISFLRIADLGAAVTPIGLFLGRLANFINGELYGRPWDGPWAMTFPCDRIQPPVPRHPSQLYEAALEGLALFVILRVVTHTLHGFARPGLATGVFLAGYGVFRTVVENFREPDQGLENLPFGLTMGMILSSAMIIGGLALAARALMRPPAPPPTAQAAA